jgi:hypothetical protein
MKENRRQLPSVITRVAKQVAVIQPYRSLADRGNGRTIRSVGRRRGDDAMTDDAIRPTTETKRPNLSTEHQQDGDARRPSDQLDKGQPSEETIPRKSSLLGDD